jgi:hypothetical protein
MSENTIDAPEPIETEVLDTEAEAAVDEATEVEEGLKTDEVSESSPDEEAKLTQAEVDEIAAKLTKKRRAAERDRDYWREQAMKKEPEKPEEVVEEPVKTLADFDYDEGAYQQHLFAKARAEAVNEAKRVLKEEQNHEITNRKLSTFRSKEAEFSKGVDDYVEAVTDPNLSISQTMADVATEMDNGPEVLYYLAKNPSLADEISRLSPLSAARELGRIEAKILNKPSAEKVSKAPAPPPKISAAEASTKVDPTKGDSDKLSTEDWMKQRNKQLRNKHG